MGACDPIASRKHGTRCLLHQRQRIGVVREGRARTSSCRRLRLAQCECVAKILMHAVIWTVLIPNSCSNNRLILECVVARASNFRMLLHSSRDLSRDVARGLQYDTCALRLTRVRAQPQASKSVTCVCIVFHATAYALFLVQVCERCQLLTVLAGAITSSIGVDGNCPTGPPIGFALQPARVFPHPALVIPTRENTPRPEPGVCGCEPCVCGEPSALQSQWSETASEGAAFLFNLVVGFAIGVCTCVTLFAVLNVGVLGRLSLLQSSSDRCQAHPSTFENLSMELRGRVVPEPWPLPPVRTPLEVEASLLDSDVQELLGTKELIGWGRMDERSAASMGHSDRISECLVRLFKLICCAIPLTAAGGGGIVESGCWTRLGNAGERRRRAPLEIVSEFSGECIRFSPDGRLPHLPSMARETQRNRGKLCAVPAPRKKNTQVLVSSWPRRGVQKRVGETFGAKRDRGPSSKASIAHTEEFAGILAALEVSGVVPIPTPGSSSPAMLEIPCLLTHSRFCPVFFFFKNFKFEKKS